MLKRKPIYFSIFSLFLIALLISCNSSPKAESDDQTAQDTTAVEEKPPVARPAHWGYAGDLGPANWASLNPAYAMCGEGKHQSPIDIDKSKVSGGIDWSADYKSTSLHIAHTEHMEDIVDNGHTIQITVDEGSTLTVEGKSYSLKQFHFHTPSEHTLNGKNQPMEMHMVHQSEDGSLAVLGVLFTEGKSPNPEFAKIIKHLPNAKGETKHVADEHLELSVHMPDNNYAYHYTGSLTTPPCSENVQWLVLRDQISLSKDQIEAFSSRIGPNNRPTHPLNDRTVSSDDVSGTVQ